ncbi:MAG: hypothetical protein LBI42_08085 [Chitinispirillales bacterium]|jgi:hypothetical protein|nr:hypothetical protein [Chitinispirillales bacterium]
MAVNESVIEHVDSMVKTNGDASGNKIEIRVKKYFTIAINATQKNYSWYLSEIPDCVVLTNTEKTSVSTFIFSFLATKIQHGKIKFKRYNVAEREESPGQEMVYYINVVKNHSSGSGTLEDPYTISNEEDFKLLQKYPFCAFRVVDYIELGQSYFDSAQKFTFKGILDGYNNNIEINAQHPFPIFDRLEGEVKNLTFSGIVINKNSEDDFYALLVNENYGVIDCVHNSCAIREDECKPGKHTAALVTINHSLIKNSNNKAPISGGNSSGICVLNKGVIENCHNDSYLDAINSYGICYANMGKIIYSYNSQSLNSVLGCVSGICSRNCNGGEIINCFNIGNMSALLNSTGICEFNLGTIDECFNSGHIKGERGVYIGGIAGNNCTGITGDSWISGYGVIKNCYNSGHIENGSGICGNNMTEISSCYNVGIVKDSYDYCGDIAGINCNKVSNCFFNDSVSITHKAVGNGQSIIAGGAKTTEEMSTDEFAATLNPNCFKEGHYTDSSYPELRFFSKNSDPKIAKYSRDSVWVKQNRF